MKKKTQTWEEFFRRAKERKLKLALSRVGRHYAPAERRGKQAQYAAGIAGLGLPWA